ncbi:MAG: methyltransferase domain-containing protein [Candidatus Saccharimonadales bacterium]
MNNIGIRAVNFLKSKDKKRKLYRCSICLQKVDYLSIEGGLGKTLTEAGFPYSLSDFETLSHKTYTCSNCGSSDRDRLYKLYLENILKGTNSNKIKLLDFAPSKLLEDYLRSRKDIRYTSADLFIDGVDDKVDIMDMDIYKDNTFDFFICSHILEHVKSDAKALQELHRVLKNDGKGILMTPIINKDGIHDEDPSVKNTKERWRRFAQDDHIRLYEKKVFIERVHKAGFKIKPYGYWNLGPMNFIRNGIDFKSRLYIVTKDQK